MTESRFQRWSRKKNEARNEAELPPSTAEEPELSPEEQELAINEALPDQEVLVKYDLPDPDAIELGTDITGFMRKEIPELLRRRALRSLWKSNPVLAVLDGLNDYDEDFNDITVAAGGLKTLYKVGQGLIDKTGQLEQVAGVELDEQIEVQQSEDQQSEVPVQVASKEQVEYLKSESSVEVAPVIVPVEPVIMPVEPVTAEDEVSFTPRYRPRMDFKF